jgi:cobalt-zinc-cadmium efflux system membrane fusion protein
LAAELSRPPSQKGEVCLSSKQLQAARIEVQRIVEQRVADTLLTAGTVTLDDQRTAHVFSPVTGRVVQIAAELGARVAKGDPLAIVESPDVGKAVSDLHKADADLLAAERTQRRAKDLYERSATSRSEVDGAEDNYGRAKAEFQRARQTLVLLRTNDGDAVTQRYMLVSPVDGEIVARNISPGVEVQGQYSGGASQELFTIGELDRVWVLGNVYEMDLAHVHVGTPASVKVIAYPDRVFSGTVDWVSGMVDRITRTTAVRCTFDNAGRFLRPAMYATVELFVGERTGLAIPRDALLRLKDSKVVFIETGQSGDGWRFRRTTVDVDEGESSESIEVKSGLIAGQAVVVHGAILLSSNL